MNIKPELKKEYEDYVAMNSNDDYSKECILAGEKFMDAIETGRTFIEALDTAIKGSGLTGFMVGAFMAGVIKFHERGEEIKPWWNKECGGSGEEDGIINPAIITIGE